MIQWDKVFIYGSRRKISTLSRFLDPHLFFYLFVLTSFPCLLIDIFLYSFKWKTSFKLFFFSTISFQKSFFNRFKSKSFKIDDEDDDANESQLDRREKDGKSVRPILSISVFCPFRPET